MGKVAVVGMGYSGAILVERLKHLTPALKVDVYDTTGSTGSGQAYQQDNLSNLVNRPASLLMSCRCRLKSSTKTFVH